MTMNKYLTLILLLLMPYTLFAQAQVSNLITPVSYFVNHVKQLKELKENLKKYRQASMAGC
ncbi:hypothetical protein [Candidatus Tisiphia endosymbiont of Beris chalybata]|uniref:hypothetical protein n=1 Tax=Candidatus Tisiphia endosymbiont of Beris chalybata TaxID=3066262 RepID=UPI00312C7E6E